MQTGQICLPNELPAARYTCCCLITTGDLVLPDAKVAAAVSKLVAKNVPPPVNRTVFVQEIELSFMMSPEFNTVPDGGQPMPENISFE